MDDNRVDWLVDRIFQCLGQAGSKGEVSIVSGVQTKLEPLLLTHLTLTIVENGLKMRKLRPPKLKGAKNSRNQTTEHYKGGPEHLKNSLCVAIKVQR
jgi:hypothetical protein